MNHTLKSLLVTSLLTLPSLMGADALSNPVSTVNREMQEISRNISTEETLAAATVTRTDVATLRLLFRDLDTTASLEQSRLNAIHDQLISTQLGEAAKQRVLARYHAIYRNLDHYLNEIIDHKAYVMADLVTFQNTMLLGTFVIVHTLLLSYGPFYYALAPFAGGVTLYVYNQLLQGFVQAVNDGLIGQFEGPKSKIHRQWAGRISTSKSTLTDLLTYTILHQNIDLSTGQLAKKLDKAFLNFSTFVKVFEEFSINK